MVIKIRMTKQNGDKRLNLYSLFLGITLMAFLGTLCLITTTFPWFIDGTEQLLLVLWIGIPLISISWFFIGRSYNKISFNDENISLCSFLPFASRKIQYSDITKIIIDNSSSKRRIETRDEFFEIDKADVASLKFICIQKSLKLNVCSL